MRLKILFVISAIYLALAGLGFLFAPAASMFGTVGPEASAALIATLRHPASLFIALALLNWLARNAEASKTRDAIVLANIVGFSLAGILDVLAVVGAGAPSIELVPAIINFVIVVAFFWLGRASMSAVRIAQVLQFAVVLSILLVAATQNGFAADGEMRAADQMDWKEVAPGHPVKAVVLWGDRSKGEYAMLLKIPAGFSFPIHAHAGDYHGINLTGIWDHLFDGGEQRNLPPGSYVFQPRMEMHSDGCAGPEDCILFIHQHVKGDFIPKQ